MALVARVQTHGRHSDFTPVILQLVYTPIEMIKSIAPDIESMSEPAVRKPSEGSCIDGTLIPMWLLWPVWQPDPMARAMSNDRRSTINDRASDGRSSDERAGGTLWGGRGGERAS